MIGRTAEPAGLPYVDIDFDVTVENAVAHLQQLGHREIVFVTERPPTESFRRYGAKVRAEASFRRVCAERGLESVLMECAQHAASGRELSAALLKDRPEATAVMVMNEQAAFGVISGLTRAGCRVPDDVSVLSISTSSEVGAMSDPVLSIMRSPGPELGRLAVEMLIDQLEDGTRAQGRAHSGHSGGPSLRLLPCELEPAESTARVRTL